VYSRALDYVTLVCAARHLVKGSEAVPPWWGIRRVSSLDGVVTVGEIRPPAKNRNVESRALARLLTHDELYAELAFVRRLSRLSRLRRNQLADLLAEVTPLDELGRVVRDRVRRRPSWRAAALRT
jgi:hypothetical protein